MKDFWKKLRLMTRKRGKVNACLDIAECIEDNILFFGDYKAIFDDETSTIRIYSSIVTDSVGIVFYEDAEAHILMTAYSVAKYDARRIS